MVDPRAPTTGWPPCPWGCAGRSCWCPEPPAHRAWGARRRGCWPRREPTWSAPTWSAPATPASPTRGSPTRRFRPHGGRRRGGRGERRRADPRGAAGRGRRRRPRRVGRHGRVPLRPAGRLLRPERGHRRRRGGRAAARPRRGVLAALSGDEPRRRPAAGPAGGAGDDRGRARRLDRAPVQPCGTAPTRGAGAVGAARAAINQLVRVLAVELGPFGIRVNAVAPLAVEPAQGSPTPGCWRWPSGTGSRTRSGSPGPSRWAGPSAPTRRPPSSPSSARARLVRLGCRGASQRRQRVTAGAEREPACS